MISCNLKQNNSARDDARAKKIVSSARVDARVDVTSGRREEEAQERQEQEEHTMVERAAEGPQLGRELDHVREEAAASTRL